MERGKRINIKPIDDSVIPCSCKSCKSYEQCLDIARDGRLKMNCIFYNWILEEIKDTKKNIIEDLKEGKYKFKESNNG